MRDQCRRRPARKQAANELRRGESEACCRPCAYPSIDRAAHSSWTEASRGDCISPRHVIIQRSDKCNTGFGNGDPGAGTQLQQNERGSPSPTSEDLGGYLTNV